MSIETLMSAAQAAGYVMVAEDELPDAFGSQPEVFEYKAQPATAVAIWRPVVPAIDGQPVMAGNASAGHVAHAWHWLTGRLAGGAMA